MEINFTLSQIENDENANDQNKLKKHIAYDFITIGMDHSKEENNYKNNENIEDVNLIDILPILVQHNTNQNEKQYRKRNNEKGFKTYDDVNHIVALPDNQNKKETE